MSSITVVGGTGYTGAAIVSEAVRRGHAVTSISRHLPADLIPGVDYVEAAATDAGALSALKSADVVVGALSPRGANVGALAQIYTGLAAQAARDGARLIVVGGFGSLRPEPGAPRYAETPGSPLSSLAEPREMLEVLGALQVSSGQLDWLFVSPAQQFGARREQGRARGVYRLGADIALFAADGTSIIEVADFALAIVDEIERPSRRRAHASVAY